MITFTESNGTQHTLKASNLNRVEVDDCMVRVAFVNEVLRFSFDTHKDALSVYNKIIEAME